MVAQLLTAIVAIAKSDLAQVKALEAIVTEGDAKEVAREIVEHLPPLAGRLAMDHPIFAPYSGWDVVEQISPFQCGTEFGAEDKGERLHWHEIVSVPGRQPRFTIRGEPTASHQQMDVRMIKHGPGPGVQYCQAAPAATQIARIAGQLLQSGGG